MSMAKFQVDQIRTVHIELTDKCNAACPMCVRNINGGPENPYLPRKEITLEMFKAFFPPEVLSPMWRIYFCGNYGDPALGADLVPIMRYVREVAPNVILGMNTNGGVRTPEFWEEVASVLRQKGDYCTFSIDGLEDTNHIYRRNVRWNHVMESAKAFIKAGGIAHWDYLIFKHNEHQVEEARDLSESMGFHEFQFKKTGRFVYFLNDIKISAFPVYGRNLELEYFIEPPSDSSANKAFQKVSSQQDPDLKKHYGTKWQLKVQKNPVRREGLASNFFAPENQENAYASRAKINCRVLKDKSIFISSEGLVFPCCWTAFPINTYWDNNDSLQLRELITKTGGRDGIDMTKQSLEKIIKGSFFTAISDSWTSPCAKDGKQVACATQCGEELERLSEENIVY
jgi:MoaA/NifB/PqqE/SkfB family radical SAM enzyme